MNFIIWRILPDPFCGSAQRPGICVLKMSEELRSLRSTEFRFVLKRLLLSISRSPVNLPFVMPEQILLTNHTLCTRQHQVHRVTSQVASPVASLRLPLWSVGAPSQHIDYPVCLLIFLVEISWQQRSAWVCYIQLYPTCYILYPVRYSVWYPCHCLVCELAAAHLTLF